MADKVEHIKNKAVNFIDNYQTLLILAAIGVGGYIIYKAVNSTSAIADEFFGESNGIGDYTGSPVNQNELTITKPGAELIAARLLQAMDRFGTNTDEIYTALSGKTAADFVLISQAFGTPRYDGAGEAMWPAAKRSLSEWLTRELDDGEMKKLKEIIPGIFKK